MHRIDVDTLKARFLAACDERGVDPVSGSTVYQAANVTAEVNKRTHNRRMAALTTQHEARIVSGTVDAHGVVEVEGVGRDGYEARLTPDWWTNPAFWQHGVSPEVIGRETEYAALTRVRLLAWRADAHRAYVLDVLDLQVGKLAFVASLHAAERCVPLRDIRRARGESPLWVRVVRRGRGMYQREDGYMTELEAV